MSAARAEAALLFYSALFLLYVLPMELWLWGHRIRMHLRLDSLEHLNDRYHLTPR